MLDLIFNIVFIFYLKLITKIYFILKPNNIYKLIKTKVLNSFSNNFKLLNNLFDNISGLINLNVLGFIKIIEIV